MSPRPGGNPSPAPVAIVGGGFTGAMLAVHLSRMSADPPPITLFEPRPRLGAGVAYSSTDPDHRFNGPIDLVSVLPDRPGDFERWYAHHAEPDPDAMATTGQLYVRRSSFARYMDALVREHVPTLTHVRARATGVRDGAVIDETGTVHAARRVYLCTALDPPRLPAPFDEIDDLRVIADPWAPGALDALKEARRVLILGTALTAADIAATVLREAPMAHITAMSRRGLSPLPQDVLPSAAERLAKARAPSTPFLDQRGPLTRAVELLPAARAHVAQAMAGNMRWQDAFGEVRDGVIRLWPDLEAAEKRKALRHLRPYYDVHRYRMAPQLDARLREARARGRFTRRRARATAVMRSADALHVTLAMREGAATCPFDLVINCTGPRDDVRHTANRLIAGLIEEGRARPHPSGLGLDVAPDYRVRDAHGRAQSNLCALGALTRGHFGDVSAIPLINMQILDHLDRLTRQTET